MYIFRVGPVLEKFPPAAKSFAVKIKYNSYCEISENDDNKSNIYNLIIINL